MKQGAEQVIDDRGFTLQGDESRFFLYRWTAAASEAGSARRLAI